MPDESKNNDNQPGSEKSAQKHSEDFPLQQYRLVPVEGYAGEEEDEIDLVELFQTFWKKRMFIAKVTAVFFVLGLIIAFLSPKEYSANATLMPEVQSSQSTAGSLLQQYGGMLGINAGDLSGSEGTIPPQLYPNIVQTIPFQLELIDTPVTFSRYDTIATPYVFFSKIYPLSGLGYVKEYTTGLPGKIMGIFSDKPIDTGRSFTDLQRDSVLTLNKEQMETVKAMRRRLSAYVDVQSGIITISSEFPDPQAAAEIGQNAITLLKKYMRGYQTQKAMQNLKFVQNQVEKAKKQFEKAQDSLAEFRDSNLNLATAKAQTREQELQSNYDLAFNLYNSLNQRLQQAEMQVQEQTPQFSVLQPVNVPLEDNTSGFLILIVFGIMGFIIALGWVLISNWWDKERVRFE